MEEIYTVFYEEPTYSTDESRSNLCKDIRSMGANWAILGLRDTELEGRIIFKGSEEVAERIRDTIENILVVGRFNNPANRIIGKIQPSAYRNPHKYKKSRYAHVSYPRVKLN